MKDKDIRCCDYDKTRCFRRGYKEFIKDNETLFLCNWHWHIFMARDSQGECERAVLLSNPDMLDEYDFSKGVRGKYASRYAEYKTLENE